MIRNWVFPLVTIILIISAVKHTPIQSHDIVWLKSFPTMLG